MFGHYIYNIRGLMNIGRYQNLYLHKRRSDAEHMWSVARIGEALALYETEKYGNLVDMGELLQRITKHDDIELITGDILSCTKRATTAMHEAVSEVEQIVFDTQFTKMYPENWRDSFRRHILHPKDDTIEGQIVSAADTIDTILEAVEEIKLKNEENFEDILISSSEKLLNSPLQSVQNEFFCEALPEFGLDIRKHYGEKIFQHIQTQIMKNCEGDGFKSALRRVLDEAKLQKKIRLSPHYFLKEMNLDQSNFSKVTDALMNLVGTELKVAYEVECPEGDSDYSVPSLNDIDLKKPRECRICGKEYYPTRENVWLVFDFC